MFSLCVYFERQQSQEESQVPEKRAALVCFCVKFVFVGQLAYSRLVLSSFAGGVEERGVRICNKREMSVEKTAAESGSPTSSKVSNEVHVAPDPISVEKQENQDAQTKSPPKTEEIRSWFSALSSEEQAAALSIVDDAFLEAFVAGVQPTSADSKAAAGEYWLLRISTGVHHRCKIAGTSCQGAC